MYMYACIYIYIYIYIYICIYVTECPRPLLAWEMGSGVWHVRDHRKAANRIEGDAFRHH